MIAIERYHTSQEKLAAALEVSLPTVRKYLDNGMPGKNVDGFYDVLRCREWLEAHPTYWKDGEGGDDQGEETLTQLRTRKLRAECAKLEQEEINKRLRNAQLRGELIARDAIIAEAAEMLSTFKAILETIADDIAKELPESHRVMARTVAKNTVDRALRLCSQWRPSVREHDAGSSPESD